MVDRKGIISTYAYDVHGRLKKETVGTLEISYTYDENGNQLTITDATGTTSRVYDELGRVTSKTVPNIGTTTFNYDIIYDESQGYIAEVSTDPKGNETTKVYDRAGRLKFVVDEEDTTEYTYYPDGRRESLEYPDGSRQEYKYYDSGLLHILTNKKVDGSTMDTYTYKYDAAGNQLEKVEYINGVNKGKTSYTYDDLNRLETVTEPSGRFTEYTYDESGNRETETISFNGKTTVNTYTNNEQNRLEEVETQVDGSLTETTVYTYDNNGNQLTVTTNGSRVISNTYDDKNQLIRTQANGKTVVNTYNGEGLRVAKSVNGSLTRYLYEYDQVVLEVVTEPGQADKVNRNLYGTNLLMRTVDDESYYYMYNGHADVTALINVETGTIDATYYYDAFGNILESTGDVNNNITYAGYQWDEETGLYYCNARMYDPKVARFLQEDTYSGTASDPLSLNLYTYCSNNPITYYDPTGHFRVLGMEFGNPVDGFRELFLTTEEEREQTFETIRQYGGNDGYTNFVSNMGAGLAETGDLFKNPLNQMYENNREIKSFVTNDLGIKEGTFLYNSIKNVGTSVEAVGINGINLGKGAWQMGETMGKPIANTALLGINYAQMKTGNITEDDFYGWYDSWYAGAESDKQAFINLVPNMIKGIGNSSVGLYNNGLNFFNPHATIEQKTQAVGDFYNVAFTVETAKGIIDLGVPVLKNVARNARNNFTNNTSPQFSMAGGTGIPFTEGLNAINNMGKMPIRNVVNATVQNGIGSATKPLQDHHYATNKSKVYTKQFKKIADKYKLDLNDAWNREYLPHQGRHPYAYHDYVLDQMKKFDSIANGDKGVFLKLYDQMKQVINENPDMLYKEYWNNPQGGTR